MNFIEQTKEWLTKEVNEDEVLAFSKENGVSPILSRLLLIRGIDSAKKLDSFGRADLGCFYDPFLLSDMDKAVARIEDAIKRGEKIVIYGDYDVDGVTSVSILYLYLSQRGANVTYYIPERLGEGYGVNVDAIDSLIDGGAELMITVDTGITADSEVAYAFSKGLDVIVTDHHECREKIPDSACAVINPKRPGDRYPFKELAGVGVVFKLVCALAGKGSLDEVCEKYIEYVCVGTVADVMSITDENRAIVKIGISKLEHTKILGFASLIEKACSDGSGKTRKINSSVIGFALAPRINAAGRIGRVAMAVELLTTNDPALASEYAEELCRLNRERQEIENEILSQAQSLIAQNVDLQNDKAIILASENWHQGVIGIVASKLTEKYGLPCILIAFDGNVGKGSGRSVSGFNINEALSNSKEHLIKYGGHELAAGLSVERDKFDDFVKSFLAYAKSNLNTDTSNVKTVADCRIDIGDVTLTTASDISKLEPFGAGNQLPLFISENVYVKSLYPIGQNRHSKLILSDGEREVTALFFGRTPTELAFANGDKIDLLYNIDVNEFRGEKSVQMIIKDTRMCFDDRILYESESKKYSDLVDGTDVCEECIPEMSHFKAAYICLRRVCCGSNVLVDVSKLSKKISDEFSLVVGLAMMNLILDVFCETGLIELKRLNIRYSEITLKNVKDKVNLEKSEIIKRIREKI